VVGRLLSRLGHVQHEHQRAEPAEEHGQDQDDVAAGPECGCARGTEADGPECRHRFEDGAEELWWDVSVSASEKLKTSATKYSASVVACWMMAVGTWRRKTLTSSRPRRVASMTAKSWQKHHLQAAGGEPAAPPNEHQPTVETFDSS